MPPWVRELLVAAREGLQSLYGRRLHGVYLFGSHARGEAAADSDVDLLVVLDRVDHYAGEVERTSALVADLALRHDVSISCVFLSATEWRDGQGPFVLNVRDDAVAA
jgi:predicted nucleotidyltransferase